MHLPIVQSGLINDSEQATSNDSFLEQALKRAERIELQGLLLFEFLEGTVFGAALFDDVGALVRRWGEEDGTYLQQPCRGFCDARGDVQATKGR